MPVSRICQKKKRFEITSLSKFKFRIMMNSLSEFFLKRRYSKKIVRSRRKRVELPALSQVIIMVMVDENDATSLSSHFHYGVLDFFEARTSSNQLVLARLIFV